MRFPLLWVGLLLVAAPILGVLPADWALAKELGPIVCRVFATPDIASPRVRLASIRDLTPAEQEWVKAEIVALSIDVHQEGLEAGQETMYRLRRGWLDRQIAGDASLGLHQIAFDENGRVAAFAIAEFRPAEGAIELEKLAVAWDRREEGIAGRLLARLAAAAARLGVPTIEVQFIRGNERARRAYERFGFAEDRARGAEAYATYRAPTDAVLARTAEPSRSRN